MLDLSTVTLLAVDTANHALALRALTRSAAQIRFARTLWLTDAVPAGIELPSVVDVRLIAPLASRETYSQLVLKHLPEYIDTPYVLLIQWDGYVVNPSAWRTEFLDCDFIGARWFWQPEGFRVGNGGFSLRSRKLLAALADPRIELIDTEDLTIGRSFRPLLESDYGIRFADERLAEQFAFEAAYPIGMPFGFHGLFNFCRIMPQDELASLVPHFSDAIARSPQLAQLLRNCVSLSQWTAAVSLAKRRLVCAPDDSEARALLAQAETGMARGPVVGRNDPCPCGSGKRYRQCHGDISRSGGGASSPARMTLAQRLQQAGTAHQRGDLDAAASLYRSVLTDEPDNALALHYLGVIAYQQDRLPEAMPLLERSVLLAPNEPEFHNNLGLAWTALDRYADAIDSFRRALALNDRHAVAWNNLGLALLAARAPDDAIAAHRRAVALQPDYVQAHWNLALALLLNQEYAEGWQEYEWRTKVTEFARTGDTLVSPRWQGEDVAGKTVLLTSEQGLGDALQFVRFAVPLAARGARVLIEALPPIANLLATAPGIAGVVACDASTVSHDYRIPLLSLPRVLRTGRGDIPVEVPYLRTDRNRRADVAATIAGHRGPNLCVGLAWSGAAANTNNRRRSCPPALLAPLLERRDTLWFSLHKSEAEAQMGGVPGADRMLLLDARNDLDGTAAMIEALDLVITVDTSIAHLAGALGKPVWLMLAYAADWRWAHGPCTPWYPTARLFRQPTPGDWPSVVRDIDAALAEARLPA